MTYVFRRMACRKITRRKQEFRCVSCSACRANICWWLCSYIFISSTQTMSCANLRPQKHRDLRGISCTNQSHCSVRSCTPTLGQFQEDSASKSREGVSVKLARKLDQTQIQKLFSVFLSRYMSCYNANSCAADGQQILIGWINRYFIKIVVNSSNFLNWQRKGGINKGSISSIFTMFLPGWMMQGSHSLMALRQQGTA